MEPHAYAGSAEVPSPTGNQPVRLALSALLSSGPAQTQQSPSRAHAPKVQTVLALEALAAEGFGGHLENRKLAPELYRGAAAAMRRPVGHETPFGSLALPQNEPRVPLSCDLPAQRSPIAGGLPEEALARAVRGGYPAGAASPDCSPARRMPGSPQRRQPTAWDARGLLAQRSPTSKGFSVRTRTSSMSTCGECLSPLSSFEESGAFWTRGRRGSETSTPPGLPTTEPSPTSSVSPARTASPMKSPTRGGAWEASSNSGIEPPPGLEGEAQEASQQGELFGNSNVAKLERLVRLQLQCSAMPEAPAPPGAAFSCGTVGHPDSCAVPCKFFGTVRGCKDGMACSHCHACQWRSSMRRTMRSRRSYDSEDPTTATP